MSSFNVYFTDGGYVEFPEGGEQAEGVVQWFRDAVDGNILSLRTETGVTTHVRKRDITRIVVTE